MQSSIKRTGTEFEGHRTSGPQILIKSAAWKTASNILTTCSIKLPALLQRAQINVTYGFLPLPFSTKPEYFLGLNTNIALDKLLKTHLQTCQENTFLKHETRILFFLVWLNS